MAAAAGGATQHPRGVNENKVNAFSPYYLTLEEKEAGVPSVSGGREAGNQNSERHGGNLPASLIAATLFARRGGAPRRHALTGSSQGAEASQPD